MTLADLLSALRRFWPLVLGVFALTVGLGAVAAFLPGEKWQSTGTLIVEPAGERELDFGAAETVEFLLPPIVKRVESASFRNAVEQTLPPRLQGSSLSLAATTEPGTSILTIEAQSKDPEASRQGARQAMREVVATPVSRLSKASVLEGADQPESVTAKRRPPILAGSVVLGLIAALLAAVAAGAFRKRLPEAGAVSAGMGLDVLGEIPSVRNLPSKASQLFQHEGPPEVVEAFHKLAATFQIQLKPESVVAITSWGEGEGKTTVTANLAYALAVQGTRVTAVDCDLRHPRLHEYLGVGGDKGVADIAKLLKPDLTGPGWADEASVKQPTDLKNLAVIPAGLTTSHPVEALHVALPAFAHLHVLTLVDAPPILAAETAVIATRVDAVVLVVDSKQRNPTEVEETLRELRLSGANVVGIVSNRAQSSKAFKASQYYRTALADRRRLAKAAMADTAAGRDSG